MNAEITFPVAASFDQAEIRGLAFALGFFFSFRLAIVLFSARWLGVEPSTGSALSVGLDLMLFGLICFATVGGQQRTVRSELRLPAMRWVLAYLAFACLSLAWSESADLLHSLAYWIGLVTDVANITLLLRVDAGTGVARAVMKGFVWSSCFLALVAWLMPAANDLRLGDPEFFNTNEIANLCAFALFFAQFLTRRNDGRWRFAKFLLALTLVRSLSKSTLAAFLVGESFLLVCDRSMGRKIKMLLISGVLAVVIVFWGLFVAYLNLYTTSGNQAETLTGRTAIWLYVVHAVSDRPWNLWIGHGFDSWWNVVPPFANGMFEARHAENELLQQFYAYGAAGVVLLTGTYGSLCRQIGKLGRSPTRILFLSVLVFIVVRGLAVADPFDLLLPLWSIALISAIVDREAGHKLSYT